MRRVLLAIIMSGVAAFAQTKPVAFEIADVHASPVARNRFQRSSLTRNGRYEIHKATMADLIRIAYGLPELDYVIGGPAWLEADRFEVISKSSGALTFDSAKALLRELLADRFKLVIHNETRPIPGWVLSLGKGKPKIKEADGTGTPGCIPEPGPQGLVQVACHSVTMERLAQTLRAFGYPVITTHVVDATGLTGLYDFDFRFSMRGIPGSSDAIAITDAVEKQLGLKIELKDVPTQVVVVDSVNRKPTDNAPDVAKRLPTAGPPEIEAAVIKPSAPNSNPGRSRNDPGLIDFHDMPLRSLIILAFEIPGVQELYGAPKWLQSDSPRFDVMAKVAVSPDRDPRGFEDTPGVLQTLLQDRFQLKVHYEDRPVTAYTLTANKPKFKAADPASRTKCKSEPLSPRDGGGQPGAQVTCTNMTLQQFADALPGFAPAYLQYPVLDGTNVEGSFDFLIKFTRANPQRMGAAKGGRGGGPDAGGDSASDPSGIPDLFGAIQRLGLKLEAQKRPYPVMVIDHLEEKPTEN
jgi:uncharacterized protein (TIGR03435 family)